MFIKPNIIFNLFFWLTNNYFKFSHSWKPVNKQFTHKPLQLISNYNQLEMSTHLDKYLQNGTLWFCTGNSNKLKEAKSIMSDVITLEQANIDLPELQGEPLDISRQKCRQAFKILGKPVLVEDTSLCFNALNGLPGPYSKWFVTKIGPQGMMKLLSAFEDKGAIALCIFSIWDGQEEPITFTGSVNGKIVEPRGSFEFGWDPIFQPDGYTQTYAEMDKSVKNKMSHRYLALENLKKSLIKSTEQKKA